MEIFNWLAFCNIAGDAAFCTGGILTAKRYKTHWIVCVLSGLSSTFFGGAFFRDMLTLNENPKILENPVEIMLVSLFAVILILIFSNRWQCSWPVGILLLKKTLLLFDSLGVLAFSAIGYEIGIMFNGTFIIALTCGFYTACGGGIIATIIRCMLNRDVFTQKCKNLCISLYRNIPYYYFVHAITLTYSFFDMVGIDKNSAVIVLTPLAVLLGMVSEKVIERLPKSQSKSEISVKPTQIS